jgi:hypothetical protein
MCPTLAPPSCHSKSATVWVRGTRRDLMREPLKTLRKSKVRVTKATRNALPIVLAEMFRKSSITLKHLLVPTDFSETSGSGGEVRRGAGAGVQRDAPSRPASSTRDADAFGPVAPAPALGSNPRSSPSLSNSLLLDHFHG